MDESTDNDNDQSSNNNDLKMFDVNPLDRDFLEESEANTEVDSMPTLEDEIGKFMGFIVMGLTGKDPRQLAECDSVETLISESEKHMQWIAKSMDYSSIKHMIYSLNKLKRVSSRFEEILYQEQELRERRHWWLKER